MKNSAVGLSSGSNGARISVNMKKRSALSAGKPTWSVKTSIGPAKLTLELTLPTLTCGGAVGASGKTPPAACPPSTSAKKKKRNKKKTWLP